MFIPALFPIVQMWATPNVHQLIEEINKEVVLPNNGYYFENITLMQKPFTKPYCE